MNKKNKLFLISYMTGGSTATTQSKNPLLTINSFFVVVKQLCCLTRIKYDASLQYIKVN